MQGASSPWTAVFCCSLVLLSGCANLGPSEGPSTQDGLGDRQAGEPAEEGPSDGSPEDQSDGPRPEPNKAPNVTVTHPVDDQTVQGSVTIEGTAADSDDRVEFVQVRIDSGDWMLADGTTEWEVPWDTDDVEPGRHLIEAVATDDTGQRSKPHFIQVEVDPQPIAEVKLVEGRHKTGCSGGTISDLRCNLFEVTIRNNLEDEFLPVDADRWRYALDDGTAHDVHSVDSSEIAPESESTVTVRIGFQNDDVVDALSLRLPGGNFLTFSVPFLSGSCEANSCTVTANSAFDEHPDLVGHRWFSPTGNSTEISRTYNFTVPEDGEWRDIMLEIQLVDMSWTYTAQVSCPEDRDCVVWT